MLFGFLIWACQKEPREKEINSGISENPVVVKSSLVVENSVERLLEIRNYSTQKIVDNNVSLVALKAAYLENNEE